MNKTSRFSAANLFNVIIFWCLINATHNFTDHGVSFWCLNFYIWFHLLSCLLGMRSPNEIIMTYADRGEHLPGWVDCICYTWITAELFAHNCYSLGIAWAISSVIDLYMRWQFISKYGDYSVTKESSND